MPNVTLKEKVVLIGIDHLYMPPDNTALIKGALLVVGIKLLAKDGIAYLGVSFISFNLMYV